MDYYLQALQSMQYILKSQPSNRCFIHWASWLDKDINAWVSTKSTRHHLSAYGGMGSFNDLSPMEGISTEHVIIFSFLKSFCFRFVSLYGRRDISIVALQEECLYDICQESDTSHKKVNEQVADFLREGTLLNSINTMKILRI